MVNLILTSIEKNPLLTILKNEFANIKTKKLDE